MVRWLRQQRYERSVAGLRGQWNSPQWSNQFRSQFAGDAPFSASTLSAKARGVSALIARQLNASAGTAGSRARRGYSTAARPGFRANRFVNSPTASRSRRGVAQGQSVQQRAHLIQQPAGSPPLERRPRPARSTGPVQAAATSSRDVQGPPLNLPPAPRGRSARRGRRIY